MILCHGETLIDFIPTEARDGSPVYRPANGGSPGNVAITLGRLGVPVGFVGGVSNDLFGDALIAWLADSGVSLDTVSRLDRPTMLAFVDLKGEEPRYAFFDAQSAPRNWSIDALPSLRPDVKALHFGSLSLIRMPAAESFEALMRRESSRRVISFDPNIRPSLVEDEPVYRRRLETFFTHAHVIKSSKADLDWIAPGAKPEDLARRWLAAEARLVVLTQGGEGATVFTRRGKLSRPSEPIVVADTVGAGDSFMGGFLAALHDRDCLDPAAMDRLSESDLADVLDFALSVAAITCSRIGADPPRRVELPAHLRTAQTPRHAV